MTAKMPLQGTTFQKTILQEPAQNILILIIYILNLDYLYFMKLYFNFQSINLKIELYSLFSRTYD